MIDSDDVGSDNGHPFACFGDSRSGSRSGSGSGSGSDDGSGSGSGSGSDDGSDDDNSNAGPDDAAAASGVGIGRDGGRRHRTSPESRRLRER